MTRLYAEELSSIKGITLHPEMPRAKCVYWLYFILINEEKMGMTRDKLEEKLQDYGIETRNLFHLLHEVPPTKSTQIFRTLYHQLSQEEG